MTVWLPWWLPVCLADLVVAWGAGGLYDMFYFLFSESVMTFCSLTCELNSGELFCSRWFVLSLFVSDGPFRAWERWIVFCGFVVQGEV